MKASTTRTKAWPMRTARHVVLALAVCALAIPATASAHTGYSSVNAITGDSSDPSQPVGGPEYASLNSVSPPPSTPSGSDGSANVDPGYSSLSAITGSPADGPTFASSPAAGSGEGFDWPSALVGAGAALALATLGGAALLTVRRRTAISPSASTS